MTKQQGAPEAPTAAQLIARFEREDGYRLEGAVPREWALEAYNELRRLAALVEAQQPAPKAPQQAAPSTEQVEEILRERDDAEDFIDALLDEVLGHERPEWSSAYGRADALNDVQERMTALHKPAVDKAWDQFQSAMEAPQQPAPSAARPVTPYTCPKCHALWLHWPAEQTGFGRDTLNCRSADHCHYCEKAGVEQLQRLERVPAALTAPKPSPTPQADSQPAADEIVSVAREQGLPETEIEGVFRVNADDLCRVVAADRAARAQADSGAAPVGGVVAAHRVMRKRLDGEWVCDGRYWCDGPPSKELVESICADKDRWRVDVAYTTPTAQAQAGAVPLTKEQITAAAKKLAECMDYPWDHMPEQGRAEMRTHARAVIAAANGSPPPTA